MGGRLFSTSMMLANAVSMLALLLVGGVSDAAGVRQGLFLLGGGVVRDHAGVVVAGSEGSDGCAIGVVGGVGRSLRACPPPFSPYGTASPRWGEAIWFGASRWRDAYANLIRQRGWTHFGRGARDEGSDD